MAFVIDVYARRMVGWRVSRTQHASFLLDKPCTNDDLPTAMDWSITATGVSKADSTGRRNTHFKEVKMTTGKQKSERSTRRKLCSPG